MADEPVLNLAYSESSFFSGRQSDATNEEEWDLPLPFHVGNRTGGLCVAPEFNRGAFKYLTLYIDASTVVNVQARSKLGQAVNYITDAAQKVLSLAGSSSHFLGEKGPYSKPSVGISKTWVNCTSFPSQKNGRAYSGYFHSSSSLLNRIWYAGAYTLQLSTIDPTEGSALIPVNRYLDHNESPPGSWYSNFTVAKGTAVTTDGAKRDRLVWPGDMYIAIPSIAVSSYDMLAVRNALDVIFEHQYDDGSIPYAGPPLGYRGEFSDTYHLHTLLGAYDYVLYSGDIDWLRKHWKAYKQALKVSTAKVDKRNLMHVSSRFDWNRHGMGGHNIEATALLHAVLRRSVKLASWLSDYDDALGVGSREEWTLISRNLQKGIQQLYCNDTGLYSDNLSKRHCTGVDHVDPQDGNSWALIAGMRKPESDIPTRVSKALQARWNKFGAPAPEFPNVMSPFSSSFEFQAHCIAGNHDAAIELMLLMWGYLLDGPGFTNSTLAEGFRTDGYVHYPAYPVPSRNSHAHGWAAGPTSTLMNHILGIQLLSPGGETWRVKPVLTKWLGWARGGFAVGTGTFEVMMWRVALLNKEGERKSTGVVAVVRVPEGTNGQFVWGGRQDNDFVTEIRGGETRAWACLDENDGKSDVEEIEALDDIWEMKDGEAWYKQSVPYGNEGVLVFDDTFQEPSMEERGPGEVDWKALKDGYVNIRGK